jgi:hypothetical protein
MKKTLSFALLAAVAFAMSLPAKATTLNLGILTNYALVDLGSGTTLRANGTHYRFLVPAPALT